MIQRLFNTCLTGDNISFQIILIVIQMLLSRLTNEGIIAREDLDFHVSIWGVLFKAHISMRKVPLCVSKLSTSFQSYDTNHTNYFWQHDWKDPCKSSGAPFSSQMRVRLHATDVTSLEMPWWQSCRLWHHPPWSWQWVGQWWSGDAHHWRAYLHVKVNGTLTAVLGWNPQSDCQTLMLVHWVPPGAGQRQARECRQALDDESTDATDWPFHSPLNPIECLLVFPTPPSTATDCPGAHRWPNPGLGGDGNRKLPKWCWRRNTLC